MTFANEMKAIGVKITHEHEIRRVSFVGNTFSALRALIASLFSLEEEKITIKYRDDEEDLITMSVDYDVQEAIRQAEQTKMRTVRLFITACEQPAPTTTPAPAQQGDQKCEERKKEWKAKREAFMREMREARGLLFTAKQAGDTQTEDKMRAKVQELRAQWGANRQLRLTLLPTPPHIIARIGVPPCAGIAQKGSVDAQNRQALWADLRREIHENRVALLEAKARGDMQTVQEFRDKICKIRQEHRAKLGHCMPLTALPIGPALGAPGRHPAHPAHLAHAHAAKFQKRQAFWEAFRQEKQGLLDALVAAKKSGDAQAITEAQRKMKEFRERAHRARQGKDETRCPHPRIRLPLGIPRPFIARPGPIPAPTPAPAQDWQARRAACEAVRQERAQLRNTIQEAKAKSDFAAVSEAREQIRAMRERHIAMRIARAEARASAPSPVSAPAPAPVSCPAPSPAPTPAPAVVSLAHAPSVRVHRLAHKLALRHPHPCKQMMN